MLTSELETIDLAANNDVMSTSNLIRRRQQKQVGLVTRTTTTAIKLRNT